MKYDVTKDLIAIHCRTQKEASEVLDKFIELGVPSTTNSEGMYGFYLYKINF